MDWLVAVAPDPGACRRQWERDPGSTLLLPAGRRWDVLTLPASLGGPALDVLIRLVERPGPVLADTGEERMGFFVPAGTAGRWLGTGVRGAGRGTWIVVPHPAGRAHGLRWLVPPDGSGALTDPAVLELALHEAAATLGERGRGANGEHGADGERGADPGCERS
ncbi:hypothetical protein JFN87_01540 [Streptomyces bomunensis]|uniref:DNA primase/polymerase bifunctional N-terminal domain-containing protein n=1 Tax=Streptomyces montanisoli TaxID=2798581 RepID=A0A940M9W7_9ACTN|nr:hypothetical protein [Streptomyces montanisoli]